MRWVVCVVQEKMSSTAGDSVSRLNQFKNKGKDANVGESVLTADFQSAVRVLSAV